MAKNWAIAIGINQYNPNNFASLKYAKRDAELMCDFFYSAGFDEVCFFTDDSPDLALPNGAIVPTQPTFDNLVSFLEDRFEHPFLAAGDNCWFFFAGHGMQFANRDYLMPRGASPRAVERTGIAVSYVRDRLSRCGADNVILMLDACRNEGGRDAGGIGNEAHQGIITISSCSPTERSWEIDELQQGVFTYALLEALRLGGDRNCATVERLSQYLRYRIPHICRHFGKAPTQTPRISTDPTEKIHFILLPKHATPDDIALLKTDAYRLAFVDKNLRLAEQLCIRATAAAMGRDRELLNLYTQIQRLLDKSPLPIPSSPEKESGAGVAVEYRRAIAPNPPVNSSSVLEGSNGRSFVVDLGDGVLLEMLAIPGGTFRMGSLHGEGAHNERPPHQVTVAPFWTGKFVVTQAQYGAVMGKNPSYSKGANRPVESVFWHNAVKFCQQLSAKTKRPFRLPSEAEWEYACRAGTTTPFHFGDTLSTKQANCFDKGRNNYRQTMDVGCFEPNAFGLYDMHGNVWERCADHWHGTYQGAPTNGSAWINKGIGSIVSRLIRGGSWLSLPQACRSAYRGYGTPAHASPSHAYYDIGFRIVCSSPRTLT